jgi:glycosyltransferase involved in cell wall biosynthesis
MSSEPLVSIVTIFLNAEQFIEEAIESVCAQSYDNWDLLLVDDGSTDGSTSIALTWAARHAGKIRYLEHSGHQNRGTGPSRNLGLQQSKGAYIAFLDADDLWQPHKLKEQVAIMEAHPGAAMVYGASERWRSWTGNPDDRHRDHIPELGVHPNTLVQPPTLLPLFLRGAALAPCPSSVLLRREAVTAIGGFEDRFQGLYEDRSFFDKVCLKSPVFVAGDCWDRYRQHPVSLCSVSERVGRRDLARLVYLRWLETYLSAQEVTDAEVWQALRSKQRQHRYSTLSRLLVLAKRCQRRIKELLRAIARRARPVSRRR